jgi:purine-binding chemotaxis protein CheW
MSVSTDFVTFYLGGNYFGINAAEVIELNRNLDVTPVPKSAKTVRGIMNLRGQLVPAIDMYKLLNLDTHADQSESISIILKQDGFLVALLVDDAGEILSLDQDTFESPPSNFSVISRELVLGVHKLPDKLLLILDPTLINQRPEKVKNQLLLGQ